MAEIATAYVSLVPSARGIGARLSRELGAPVESAARSAGERASSAIGKILRRGVTTVGLAAGAALSASLVKGFKRFTTIENATAALTTQLGSATAAGDLLADVLKVVQGTPFNLDQFAAAAQLLVGMGIDAQKVPGYLTAIGEASATQGPRANEFADRLSNIYGTVAAQGRIMGDDINGIAATGVNALAILANHFGVTTDDMRKMVSKGVVPADEALDALSKGIVEGSDGLAGATVAFGGTMEGLRKTLSGAIGGFGAAVARFGAKLIAPFAKVTTKAFTGAADLLDRIGERAGKLAEIGVRGLTIGIEALVDGFRTGESSGEGFAEVASNIGAGLRDAWDFAARFVEAIRNGTGPVGEWKDSLVLLGGPLGLVVRDLLPALQPLIETVATQIGIIANDVGPPLVELFAGLAEDTIPILVSAIEGLTDLIEAHPAIVQTAVAIIAGRWIYLQGVAAFNAARIAVSWAVSSAGSIASAAITVLQVGIMIGRWVALALVAVVRAGIIAGAWIIANLPAVASAALAIGLLFAMGVKWVALAAIAVARAAIIAGAWLVAAGPPGWIVLAAAGSIATIVLFWDDIAAAVMRAVEAIRSFKREIEGIGDDIPGMPGGGKGFWEVIGGGLQNIRIPLPGGGSIPNPLSWFQAGGVVPGRVGAPQLAVVHGGEVIRNPGQEAQLARGRGVHIENLNMPQADIWAAVDRAELLAPLM